MAAPESADILDVTGRWSLNRMLSDSLEDTFALVSPSGAHQHQMCDTDPHDRCLNRVAGR